MGSQKRVALVIGAARGIGRAIAIDLAKEGTNVIVNYRSRPDAAEEVVKEIEKLGSKAIPVRADLANEAEVQSMVHFAMDERLKRENERILTRRPGKPEEVAELVSFLAFKGSYITGAVIQMDGGMGM